MALTFQQQLLVCVSKGPSAPRQLQRPKLPAGLSKATLASQCFKPFRRPFQGNSRSYTPQPSVFKGVQACRLLALKPFNRPPGLPQAFPQQLSQPHAPAICFSRRWSFVCPPPNASNPSFKPFHRPFHSNSRSYTPQPSVFLMVFKTAVCPPSNPPNPPAGLSKATLAASRRPFQGNSRSYTPQPMLQTSSNPSASLSKATLAATRPSHLFFTALSWSSVCPPPNASNSSFKPFRRPFLQTLPQAFRRPFQSNCRSHTPQPSVFHGVEALFARRQTLQTLPSNPSAGLSTATLAATRPSHLFLKGVQDCRLPAFKPLKCRPFQGNSRQRLQTRGGSSHDQTFPQAFPRRLSQLHAPANASNIFKPFRRPFQGNSRS